MLTVWAVPRIAVIEYLFTFRIYCYVKVPCIVSVLARYNIGLLWRCVKIQYDELEVENLTRACNTVQKSSPLSFICMCCHEKCGKYVNIFVLLFLAHLLTTLTFLRKERLKISLNPKKLLLPYALTFRNLLRTSRIQMKSNFRRNFLSYCR